MYFKPTEPEDHFMSWDVYDGEGHLCTVPPEMKDYVLDLQSKLKKEEPKNFLGEFGRLHGQAWDYIKKRLEETNEIILVNIDEETEDGCVPDEIYEMPRQMLMRKYDYVPYRIWKLTLVDDTMFAHGYDYEEGGSDHIFNIDDMYLDWSTVIEIAGII